MLEHKERKEQQDHLVNQELRGRKEILVFKEHKEILVFREHKEILVFRDRRDRLDQELREQ
jgi:hypothetical protein